MFTFALMTQLVDQNDMTGAYGFANQTSNQASLTGTQVINGSSTTYGTESYTFEANFNQAEGLIVIIVASIALVVVLGITVLGSGMKEISVKTIYLSMVLYSIWLLLSVLGIEGISSIPFFGYITYFILTLFYSLGCIAEVSGTGTGGRG